MWQYHGAMQRAITGYYNDEFGDLVATLTCGHGIHMRHRPPMVTRPWTLTPEGRESMLGTTLTCVRCERFELPPHFVPYKRTRTFSADDTPSALRAAHTTKPGVWARIHVVVGTVTYFVEAPAEPPAPLTPSREGIVVPERPHHVDPAPGSEFYVEFYRSPDVTD